MPQFQQFFQQLINGLSIGAIYALIAVGYTMVYGVLRLINFAHGNVYMVGAMTGFYAATRWFHLQQPTWAGFFLVLVCSMIVCGALGYFIELLAYRPLRNQPRIVSLITAIAVSMLLEFGGQAKWMFGPDPKPFPDLIPGVEAHPDLVHFGQLVIGKVDAMIFLIALVMMFALRYVVRKTKMGLALRAVSYRSTRGADGGEREPGDQLHVRAGIGAGRRCRVSVGLRSPKVDPLMGLLPGLKAFIAAVLGGIGDIRGALAGGFLLGITEAMVVSYFPKGSEYRDGVAFLVLIAILVVKPSGLFRRADPGEGLAAVSTPPHLPATPTAPPWDFFRAKAVLKPPIGRCCKRNGNNHADRFIASRSILVAGTDPQSLDAGGAGGDCLGRPEPGIRRLTRAVRHARGDDRGDQRYPGGEPAIDHRRQRSILAGPRGVHGRRGLSGGIFDVRICSMEFRSQRGLPRSAELFANPAATLASFVALAVVAGIGVGLVLALFLLIRQARRILPALPLILIMMLLVWIVVDAHSAFNSAEIPAACIWSRGAIGLVHLYGAILLHSQPAGLWLSAILPEGWRKPASLLVAIIGGGTAAAAAALVVGLPTLRLRGIIWPSPPSASPRSSAT